MTALLFPDTLALEGQEKRGKGGSWGHLPPLPATSPTHHPTDLCFWIFAFEQ